MRNILIHVVVALAAFHAAVGAAPAAEARACDVCPDGGAAYPGPYVAHPDDYVVFRRSGDVVGR